MFTWNLKRHRYETAYRIKNLRGVYPLQVGTEGNNPMFQFSEMTEDGTKKPPRKFVMNGVICREAKSATP